MTCTFLTGATLCRPNSRSSLFLARFSTSSALATSVRRRATTTWKRWPGMYTSSEGTLMKWVLHRVFLYKVIYTMYTDWNIMNIYRYLLCVAGLPMFRLRITCCFILLYGSFFFSMTEPKLPWAEGGDCGTVQDRSDPRAPGDPVGRHGQPRSPAEAAGRGYPHLGPHSQVRGFRERE